MTYLPKNTYHFETLAAAEQAAGTPVVQSVVAALSCGDYDRAHSEFRLLCEETHSGNCPESHTFWRKLLSEAQTLNT